MDTPDRNNNNNNNNQIGTPISKKFEDSPVFNYINSLSPIKPVKSIHIGQTFNSLSFSSPPSVFTSPHVSSQRESRFLRRNFFSGSSKPDLSCDDESKCHTSEVVSGAVHVPDCSVNLAGSFNGCSIREDIVDARKGSSELAIELPRTLKYDCGSPECATRPSLRIKIDRTNKVSAIPAKIAQFGEEICEEKSLSFQNGEESNGICRAEQAKEEQNEEDGTGCDWENLISDAAELLIFDSSNNAEDSRTENQNTMDHVSSSLNTLAPQQQNTNNVEITLPPVETVSSDNYEVNDSALQPTAGDGVETNHTPDILSSALQNKKQADCSSDAVDDKAGYYVPFGCKQRGVRRRCLVFESAGARKRKLEDDSNSSSSASSQSDGKYTSEDKHLASIRPCTTNTSPCMVPGIGLHLNALAATTKDSRVGKHDTLNSGNELISMPSSMSSVHSLSSEQNPLSKSLVLSSIQTDISPSGTDLHSMLDTSQALSFGIGEDFTETSPRKKRRRSEHGGESEACKRCNCKKSKCLKLYCECFAAGVYCVEPCSCLDCFNKPIHEDTVLATRKQIESRNPLAFAPKVIRSSDSVPEVGEESNKTPASARHKRGCNCKKSGCLKKYCECYQGGVGCSMNCRCEGCKNAFGRKEGCTLNAEGELEEEEAESNVKNNSNIILQSKDEEQFSDNAQQPLSFSFQICRTSVQLPFSSYGKPPKYSLPSRPKYEKHFQVHPEDETPEILRGNLSPISGIKTLSPNSKRVSPPHNREFTMSPGRRNNRKLVLQSIPSFPSLNQNDTGEFH
ncbi:hypothetical protein ACHQM5_027463 [Ranunculus cassubicifolius]